MPADVLNPFSHNTSPDSPGIRIPNPHGHSAMLALDHIQGTSPAPSRKPNRKTSKSLGDKALKLPASIEGRATFCEGAYLTSQRGFLYFRIRVPKELQECLDRKEYRRSLGTASRREAKPLALRLYLACHTIFTLAKEYQHMNSMQQHCSHQGMKQSRMPKPASERLTPDKIREIARISLERSLRSGYEQRLMRGSALSPEKMEDQETAAGEILSDLLEQIDMGHIPANIRAETDTLLEEFRVVHPLKEVEQTEGEEQPYAGELAYRELCDKILRTKAAALESEIAGPCWDGRLRKAAGWNVSMAETFIREREEQTAATTPPFPTDNGGLDDETVAQAVAKFIEERSRGWKTEATAMDVPKRLQTFLDIIGQDISIREFKRNRDAIRRYHSVMTAIPAQYIKKKEYSGLDWDTLVALNVPPELRFKRDTLKNNFNTVLGLLTWMEDEGYLERSAHMKKILKEFPADVEGGNKRGFTGDELSRLFAPENFMTKTTGLDRQRPWKFLVPVMALFTGARIEELCQLDLADIRQGKEEGDEGIWYLHITDSDNSGGGGGGTNTGRKSVKTRAGIRKVPLHPFLTGGNDSPVNLPEYAKRLKEAGETKLFPTLVPNKRGNRSDAVTKWFTRYRRDCGVGEDKGGLSTVTFHSFRHTVITTATKIKEVDRRKVKQMVGHEAGLNEAADITVKYEGDYPLSTIARDVIGALDFDMTLDLRSRLAGWKGK